ncbi:hypothetical protein [Emticicia agri]|uniref:Uncharacterized protein n=1 Tax=Emticicia agri TaxID=2492393 RepID=A0A4Q5LZ24_9BACT|nr:hypothetical protein [Emticicia agri]RYU95206.1 hypothetical protein EWM59_13220 [Emticicia agri]
MLTSLSNFARRYALGRNVLIFFCLQMLISAGILPYMQGKFDPTGIVGVLDLMFGFTPDEAYDKLNAYGEEGRKYYLFAEAVIDIIYPIIYTITNVLLLSYVFKKGFAPNSFIHQLNIFPILATIGDFAENAGIIAMLNAFPERADAAASFASNAGMFKWIAFGMSIALFLIGVIAWIVKVVKKK